MRGEEGAAVVKSSVVGVVLLGLVLSVTACRRELPPASNESDARVAARVDHVGFDKQCVSCHEKRRPQPPHIAGKDCILCHRPGTHWLDLKSFSHPASVNSCVRCHERDRPVPALKILNRHGLGNDCVHCHIPGTKWTDNRPFSHTPPPRDCVACHDSNRPSETRPPAPAVLFKHHFDEQDCSRCHRRGEAGQPFKFEHRDFSGAVIGTCLPCHEARRKSAEHSPGKDCVGCHIDPAKTWKLSVANPHPLNDPMPSVCVSCHVEWRPTPDHFVDRDCNECHKPLSETVKTFVFDHRARGKPIDTCLPCHEGKRPSARVGSFVHSLAGIGAGIGAGKGDCVSCHLRPGQTWQGGLFSHAPAPASCAECHASEEMPQAPVSGFTHSAANGDCSKCHTRPGFTWSETSFAHSGTLGGCSSCHASRSPLELVGKVLHSEVSTSDCSKCHRKPGETWKGAEFTHAVTPPAAQLNCRNCHLLQRPSTTVNGFSHIDASATDCAVCHTQPGVSWSGAVYEHKPVPTTCAKCHLSKRPSYVVKNFAHSVAGTGDCVTCHKNPGVSWAGAVYGHNPAPATCRECHLSRRPTGVVQKFFHELAGMGDCVSCHKSPGLTWAGGVYGHSPVPTACATCHSAQRPTTVVGNGFEHQGGCGKTGSRNGCHSNVFHNAYDCARCHTSPGTTWKTSPTGISTQAEECAYCHF